MVRARPLMVYVVALALALTLPPLAVSIIIAKQWVAAERGRLQAHTGELADNALAQVDRYIAGKIAMLQALATSPALDAADFRRIDQQARELLDLQGVTIVLRDLTGQQLVNTRKPVGAALPRVPVLEPDHRVVATRQPYVSDIYNGVVSQTLLIRIIVPVMRNGRVIYTLTASLAPETLATLLRDSGLVPPHFGTVADRNGYVIARAFHTESAIGQALPGFAEITDMRGSWTGASADGATVYGAYRRSPVSGWLFVAGIDRAELDLPLVRSLFVVVALALFIGAVAILLSLGIVRRVLQSQQQLTAAARALGDGTAVDAPETPVREANIIGEALAEASRRLGEQAAALTEANRSLERRVEARTREVSAQAMLLQVTLDTMDQGLMVIDGEGRIPICNQRAMHLLDLPPDLMATKPDFETVRRLQLARGEFQRSAETLRTWVKTSGLERGAHRYERERPNGTILEVNTVPMPSGGSVRTFTDITVHRRAEQLARHMAEHDPLTGLSNRTVFRTLLTEALADRDRSPFALLWLDLDRFKSINDTLGHPAGDALLREVARRILGEAGPDGRVARIGGDEFALLLRSSALPEAAEDLARRLVGRLSRPYEIGGERMESGVSIGIALGPRDAGDTDALLKAADMALYRAKNEGRSTYRFYEASMDVAEQERQALEHDLRLAVSRGEFELHFQPIVSLDGHVLAGFEALIRWRHPVRGMVPPVEFIGLAEEARLIAAIGRWVLREACREAARWPSHLQVAVNVSAVQFEEPGFVAQVLSALAEAGLPAHRLELEITESVLMGEGEAVVQALATLRSGGVRVALDDFGTGYSSLSYLHRFPVDRIKIDRSFVAAAGEVATDPSTAAIVRSIVGLGTSLGAAVTAEGVETVEQLAFVQREGCTEVQGYLFGRPLPQLEARALAAGRRVLAA